MSVWSIYQSAGSPSVEFYVEGICRTCGVQSTGQLFSDWVKPTFTDHDKLLPGEIVCAACLFCFSDQNEQLRQRLGKEKPQRMRNYSHFVVNGEWIPLSKGDKVRMKEILLSSLEVAVIALSGQKHIIFRARPGWWQIEEQSVLPFPELLNQLLTPVETLYNTGATKAEIESGHYSQRTIKQIGIQLWQELEFCIKPHRGGLPLQLAVFLAQKTDEDTGTTDESTGE